MATIFFPPSSHNSVNISQECSLHSLHKGFNSFNCLFEISSLLSSATLCSFCKASNGLLDTSSNLLLWDNDSEFSLPPSSLWIPPGTSAELMMPPEDERSVPEEKKQQKKQQQKKNTFTQTRQ